VRLEFSLILASFANKSFFRRKKRLKMAWLKRKNFSCFCGLSAGAGWLKIGLGLVRVWEDLTG